MLHILHNHNRSVETGGRTPVQQVNSLYIPGRSLNDCLLMRVTQCVVIQLHTILLSPIERRLVYAGLRLILMMDGPKTNLEQNNRVNRECHDGIESHVDGCVLFSFSAADNIEKCNSYHASI